METTNIIFLGAIFLFTSAIILFIFLLWQETRFTEKRTIKKRLLYISAGGKHGKERLELYKKSALRDAGILERLAFQLPRMSTIDRMLLKSGLPLSASAFIFISITLAFGGGLVANQYFPGKITPYIVGAACFFVPYLIMRMVEESVLDKFREQLPEALDLLSRAVRSGHALNSGLEMIAKEMDPPIKMEFQATVDEINLGLSLKDALANLCERVPSTEVKFFTIAILIQKETGGNIAEILDKLGRLIRERTQFHRQINTLTAEGRLSARILILLPICMFVYIYFVNYDYISLMWKEKLGIYLLAIGIVMQIIGSIFIRNIVKIEI